MPYAATMDCKVLVSIEGSCFYSIGIERNYNTAVDSYELAADRIVFLAVLQTRDYVLKRISTKYRPKIAGGWHKGVMKSGELIVIMVLVIRYAAVLAS